MAPLLALAALTSTTPHHQALQPSILAAAAPPKQISLFTASSITALRAGDLQTCKLSVQILEIRLGTAGAHSIEVLGCELHNGHVLSLDQKDAYGSMPLQTTGDCVTRD